MSFTSALKHFGSIFLKGLHVAETVEAAALPFLQIAFPDIAKLDSMILNSAIGVEAVGQSAAANTTGSGVVKLAAVTAAVGPQVIATLAQSGIKINQTQAQAYIDAIVKAVDALPAPEPTTAPPVGAAAPAQVSAPAASTVPNAPVASSPATTVPNAPKP